MGEGNCYFCNKSFWTERMIICLDCLREIENLKRSDFIFLVKGDVSYTTILNNSDLENNIEFLEKFVLPNLKKKIEKMKKKVKGKVRG